MAFELFSSEKKGEDGGPSELPVPAAVLAAVRVKGDFSGKDAARPVAPAPTTESPFLKMGSGARSISHTLQSSEDKRKRWLMWGGIALFMLLVAGAGLYLFLRAPEPTPAPVVNTPPSAPSLPPEPPLPTFALNKPNYLPFDTENALSGDVKRKLADLTQEVAKSKVTVPVEFLVTDSHNNPLAFTRFAYILGLSLAPDLLSNLDENFALYIFNDAILGPRMGLALNLKDAVLGKTLILKDEAGWPDQFSDLFYNNFAVNVPSKVTFNESQSTPFLIHYVNLNPEKTLSFDYALIDTRWYIGASRDTLRAILAKNSEPKVQTSQNPAIPNK